MLNIYGLILLHLLLWSFLFIREIVQEHSLEMAFYR
jgi:hypothetical protein